MSRKEGGGSAVIATGIAGISSRKSTSSPRGSEEKVSIAEKGKEQEYARVTRRGGEPADGAFRDN